MINKTKLDELKKNLLAQEYFEIYDYDHLIECIEGDVICKASSGDWQGDSWYLFKYNNMYGYLVFGWGSCSGCDALQGCTNVGDVEELLIHLNDSIIWKKEEEMLEYFKTKDWSVEFFYSYGNIDPNFNEFKNEVIVYLEQDHV